MTRQALQSAFHVWDYHMDLDNDVLYLRLQSAADAETYGEDTDGSLIVLRTMSDDRFVGLTVVSFWKLHGEGPLRAVSPRRLEERILRLLSELPPALALELYHAMLGEYGQRLAATGG